MVVLMQQNKIERCKVLTILINSSHIQIDLPKNGSYKN